MFQLMIAMMALKGSTHIYVGTSVGSDEDCFTFEGMEAFRRFFQFRDSC